jgi:hypothetical protein
MASNDAGGFDTSGEEDGTGSRDGQPPRAGRLLAEGGYADVFEVSTPRRARCPTGSTGVSPPEGAYLPPRVYPRRRPPSPDGLPRC